MSTTLNVAVIGAGLSGLCAARHLQASSLPLSIIVFEKSRSLGGRVATKTNFPPTVLDHGAPFFTLSPAMHRFLSQFITAETLRALQPDAIQDVQGQTLSGPTRIFSPTGNAALGAALARGLSVERSMATTVSSEGLISLVPYKEERAVEQGPFDLVIVAIPLPQAANILSPPPDVARQWQSSYTPTLTALLSYDLNLVPDTSPMHRAASGNSPYAIDEAGVFSACENYKRGNENETAVLVAHADNTFSEQYLEEDGDEWLPLVRDRAEASWGIPSRARIDSFAKRWRYARVREGWQGTETVCSWMGGKVLVTGDGACGESDVSKVMEHGLFTGELAERMLRSSMPYFSGDRSALR